MQVEIKMIINGYLVSHNLDNSWIDEYCKDWDTVITLLTNLKAKYNLG